LQYIVLGLAFFAVVAALMAVYYATRAVNHANRAQRLARESGEQWQEYLESLETQVPVAAWPVYNPLPGPARGRCSHDAKKPNTSKELDNLADEVFAGVLRIGKDIKEGPRGLQKPNTSKEVEPENDA
jgi:hypothetical protein